MINTALAHGAERAAVAAVGEIRFLPAFRRACEANHCGKYGRCWMCPPDAGEIEDLIRRAGEYREALVFQTIGRLEDSFDIEGMEAAADRHNRVTVDIAGAVTNALPPPTAPILVLGAGSCRVCPRCARADNLPCRFPERAVSSLEAYGVSVADLARSCGMDYTNGENTVTYFGVILFGKKEERDRADG